MNCDIKLVSYSSNYNNDARSNKHKIYVIVLCVSIFSYVKTRAARNVATFIPSRLG